MHIQIQRLESILHYAKVTKNLGLQQGFDHIWGTVSSGLTPGSPLDRRTSEFLVLSGSRAGKLKTAQRFIFEFGAV